MADRRPLVRIDGQIRNLPASDHLPVTIVDGAVEDTDARLTDAREWTAQTVSQAEAEAGTATTRRAWTAQRVRQAILAWWNGSAAKTKLDGIATNATANQSDAFLLARANHTGTQTLSTISDAGTAAAGNIVASVTDTTAERILTTGYAGLIHNQATNLGLIDRDFNLRNEFYLSRAAGAANRPSWIGLSAVHAVLTLPVFTDRTLQLTFSPEDGQNRVSLRTQNVGTWAAWVDLFHTGNFDPATKSNLGHTHTLSDITDSGTAAAGDIVTSATDTTSGRILTTGYANLLSTSLPSATDSQDNNTRLQYALTRGQNQQNSPSWIPYNSPHGVFVLPILDNRGLQLTFAPAGTANRVSIRTYAGGVFADWVDLFHTGNFDPSTKSNVGHTHTLSDITDSGTAAAGTLTTSRQDTTIGRVQRVGDAGLASLTSEVIPNDATRRGSGVYMYSSVDSPYVDQSGPAIRINGSGNGRAIEFFGITAGGSPSRFFGRSQHALDSWSPPVEFWTTQNFNPGTAASADLTTTQTSTTLNEVVKVGDYGIGVGLNVLSGGVDYNTLTVPGDYAVLGFGSTNAPNDSGANFMVTVSAASNSADNDTVWQRATVYGSTARTFERTFSFSQWSPWREVWTSAVFDPNAKANFITEVVALGGDFGTGEARCSKAGNVVTITMIGTISHNSLDSLESGSGAIPGNYRPNHSVTVTPLIQNGVAYQIIINAVGRLTLSYRDPMSTTMVARTSTGFPHSVTFNRSS